MDTKEIIITVLASLIILLILYIAISRKKNKNPKLISHMNIIRREIRKHHKNQKELFRFIDKSVAAVSNYPNSRNENTAREIKGAVYNDHSAGEWNEYGK